MILINRILDGDIDCTLRNLGYQDIPFPIRLFNSKAFSKEYYSIRYIIMIN